MRAIITVIGVDQIGIIAEVSTLLAEKKANILDISQTILDDYFTMTMLVDLENLEISLEDLNTYIDKILEGNLKGRTIVKI